MNSVSNGSKGLNMQVLRFPRGAALKSKLMRYAESRPEEVRVMAENEDGSAFFHIPISYIKLSPPRKVSEEQREAAGERFRKMWEEKKGENVNEQSDSDGPPN